MLILPFLNFKFGTLDKLTSENTKNTVLESLSNGDICFATYGPPSAAVETTSNAEGSETQEQAFTPEAGALYIKMDGELLPVSLPPGPIGIPLVGQGDGIPIYTSTLSPIGIGGVPINDPTTKTDENTESIPYSITAYENSLFKKDIVFESKIRNIDDSFSLTSSNYYGTEILAPQGLIFSTSINDSIDSYSNIGDRYFDIYFSDWSNGEGQEMWWSSDLDRFISGELHNYTTGSETRYWVDQESLQYYTTYYYEEKEEVKEYSSSISIGKNNSMNTNAGSTTITAGLAKIAINNTTSRLDPLPANSILIKTGTKDCLIKLESPAIDISSPSISLLSKNSIFIKGETTQDPSTKLIDISSSSITLAESVQIIKDTSIESSWWDGRDCAMICLENNKNGYYPLLSMMTKNGNWQMGTCPKEDDDRQDKLIFTYVTDTNYSNQNNTTLKHIKFSKEGMIESEALQSNNYGTKSPEDTNGGNKINNLINGTLYFRILE